MRTSSASSPAIAAGLAVLALIGACTGGPATTGAPVDPSVGLALAEACQNVDAAAEENYVVSPGQVVLDEGGDRVVHTGGEVVAGEESALVGVGVALAGVTAGDAGIAVDDSMDISFSPADLQGPGTWPLVVVYDRSRAAEIVLTERDGSRRFTMHLKDECGDGPAAE